VEEEKEVKYKEKQKQEEEEEENGEEENGEEDEKEEEGMNGEEGRTKTSTTVLWRRGKRLGEETPTKNQPAQRLRWQPHH
jgi:hypothetical protein